MKIPFKKTWILLEKEDYANYLFVSATWEGYTTMAKQWGFENGRFMGAEYINSACNLFQEKSAYDIANKKHFEMLFTKPQVWERLHQTTEKNSRALFAFGRKVRELNPASLSDRGLVEWIERFQTGQGMVHCPRGPMFLLETPNNLVTSYLQNYLREKYQNAGRPKIHPNEAFQILTTPLEKSIWASERESLARIKLMSSLRQAQAIKIHAKKYEWLEYGLQGKILSLEHFASQLRQLPKSEAQKLLNHNKQSVEIKRQQTRIFAVYKIHPEHRRIFKIVQEAFYTRLLSKDSQFFGYYSMESLFLEFGRRVGLSLEQVRYLHHREFREVLMKKIDYSALTSARQKYSLFVCDRGQTASYVGAPAKKIRKQLKFYESAKKLDKTSELKGQPAFKGKAKGRVKIINTVQEMAKMHLGNILVSHMTNPGIVPAMKQAAAIVTDLGGITCHAAIVARELKKPCVIGTHHATEVLLDGDMVEVDANKGIVKKI
ncbi:MAG: PEP-utilizing enzyme [Patescibacteria group bacterium]|nr:PEP-utilizing enzyme [Patescibacteria group bacterium]